MHHLRNAVTVARADLLCHRNACSDRKAHEQVDDQIDQRAARANRRHRRICVIRPVSHNHHIRRVIQQLDNAGEHNGKHEQNDVTKHWALGIILLFLMPVYTEFPHISAGFLHFPHSFSFDLQKHTYEFII